MQRDHRCESAVAHATQHVPITFERVLIPCIGSRLDATPFHAETMRVLSTFRGAVQILLPATAPPIGSQTTYPLRMTVCLPHTPLIIGVIPLHLIRGGRCPP